MEKLLAKIPTWFPHDKCLHFISGAAGYAMLIFVAKLFGMHGLKVQIISILTMAILALLKEYVYDARRLDRHSVDILDAVATTAGAALCFLNSFCS